MRIFFSESEAVANDQLNEQVVGVACHADAHAEIHFGLRRQVQVIGREELLLSVAQRMEALHRASGDMVFNPYEKIALLRRPESAKLRISLDFLLAVHARIYLGCAESMPRPPQIKSIEAGNMHA